jgi:hypothetical protein
MLATTMLKHQLITAVNSASVPMGALTGLNSGEIA